MGTDLNLTGPQQAQLLEALLDAFRTRDDAVEVVRQSFNVNLEVIAPPAATLDQVWFRVIDWASANGELPALVAAARQRRPNNQKLNAFAEQTCSDPTLKGATGQNRALAARGLFALQALMQNGDVRSAVAEFQTDFEAAASQIELLGLFKDLHDLLHTLQFQCYKGIAQESRHFPDDDAARDILADHELTLDGIVQQLREVAARPAAASVELGWIQDLGDAHRELDSALQQLTAKPVARVLWLMDRVLAVQPSQINTRLNMAARALRLTEVVRALTRVHDRFTGGGADPGQLESFRQGIDSLQALQQTLSALVSEHDRWQALDLDLRRIQANLRTDTQELELSWDRVKVMADPLCGGQDAWAADIRATCETLGNAVAAQDPSKERQAFQRLYAQAADRFYRVDTSLKRLCETLRAVGQPLTSLLGMLK